MINILQYQKAVGAPKGATQQALIAVRAAKHIKQWGRLPARIYASKRGVSPQMYRLARLCEAANKISNK